MSSSEPSKTRASTGEDLSKFLRIQCGGGIVIRYRKKDSYIHATGMCQAYNKLVGHWWQNKQTQDFLKILSPHIGIPICGLVQKSRATGPDGGTWVHPDVAVQLAMWLDNLLTIRVIQWNRKMMTGDLSLVAELAELHAQLHDREVKTTVTSVPKGTLSASELTKLHSEHAAKVQQLEHSVLEATAAQAALVQQVGSLEKALEKVRTVAIGGQVRLESTRVKLAKEKQLHATLQQTVKELHAGMQQQSQQIETVGPPSCPNYIWDSI
jgi:hypothetical protein